MFNVLINIGRYQQYFAGLSKKIVLPVLFLISVAILIKLILEIDLTKAYKIGALISPLYIFAAIIILWVHYFISAVRYIYVLNKILPDITANIRTIFSLTIFTSFLTVTLPIGGLGDAARINILWANWNIPGYRAIESVIYDRVLAVIGIIFLGLVFLPYQYDYVLPKSVVIQLIIFSISFFLLFVVRKIISFFLPRKGHFRNILLWVQNIRMFFEKKKDFFIQLVIAFFSIFTIGISFWLCAVGLGINLPLFLAVLIAPIILFVQSIPVTYAGWGGREAVVMTLLEAEVMSSEEALVLSILFGLVIMFSTLPGALIYIINRDLIHKNT